MKKFLPMLVALLGLGLAPLAGAFEATHVAGDVTVKVSIDSLETGRRDARIVVLDGSGNEITDAKVKLYYGMRPTSGMAPMNYKAIAEPNGAGFDAVLDFPMKGDWLLTVKVRRPGAKGESVEMDLKVG